MWYSILIILLVLDMYYSYKMYNDSKRYRKALEDIAYSEHDMNKLIGIAIRALK